MKTWNPTPSTQTSSAKRAASVAAGPNHAANAAALCAAAVLIVLLLAQWLPPMGLPDAIGGETGSQISGALLHTETTTMRMLRF